MILSDFTLLQLLMYLSIYCA